MEYFKFKLRFGKKLHYLELYTKLFKRHIQFLVKNFFIILPRYKPNLHDILFYIVNNYITYNYLLLKGFVYKCG